MVCLLRGCVRQRFNQAAGQQGQPGELLLQVIVQFLTDAPVLFSGGVQYLSLQCLYLCQAILSDRRAQQKVSLLTRFPDLVLGADFRGFKDSSCE